MRPVRSLWLAGPEAWLPDAQAQDLRRKALCLDAGFTPFSGGQAAPGDDFSSEIQARELYMDRMAQLRQVDAAIVNLTPWRGASCDTGVAFEAGVLAGLGKPVFAYLNVEDESLAEYVDRVGVLVGAEHGEDGVWRDENGCVVEDLGLPESVMLWAEARRLFVIVTPEPLHDLTGLEMCLQALRLYAE